MKLSIFNRGEKVGRLVTVARAASVVAVLVVASLLGPAQRSQASLTGGNNNPDVLIGADNDNLTNPAFQPAGTAANQTLNNTDVLSGKGGNDVLVGLGGSDVMTGGPGNDILIGGPEQFVTPNSDIIAGDEGDDISIWAPGDGSELFLGGDGFDVEIFGVIDRNAANVPTSAGPAPGFANVPSANVSGSPGFCTVERSPDPSYEWLAKFFVRATGALAVTVRLVGVEAVVCTSVAGGQITVADLSQANPQFVNVALADIQRVNPVIGKIIR
jgi:Ca2+-binding RTX toxin-like protein